jgi:hypothetical protein
MNARSALLLSAAALAALLAACSRNPAADDSVQKNEAASKAQADSDSAAAAMLLPAYELNRDASSQKRLLAMKATADQPAAEAGAPLPPLGPSAAGTTPGLAPRSQPNIAKALLKRPALGKASAVAGADTAYFVYDDSSQGRILWVHAYAQSEGGAAVEARDSLTYKWPYGPNDKTVLAHRGSRAYANGARLAYAFTDEDGDGILNEAVAGTKIRLTKTWITVHADTTWKSIHHTVHGSTDFYDSIGPGQDTGWVDTVFVGGKVVSWQRLMDGDKDGFVLTAAPGTKVRVNRDRYVELADGVFRIDHESFGPGKDGDFLAEADNERYPFSSQTIDGAGKAVADTKYGDADGDGFYFDPAAAAGGNRAWIVNAYPANDSVKATSDSLALALSGPGGQDALVSYYSAAREYLDGRKSLTYTRIPGKDAFGGSDLVQVWEKRDLSGWKGKGDADSVLRVTWVIPGVLGDPSDDKVAKTYAQTWYKPGQASVSVSELLVAEAPAAAGAAPQAGEWTREVRLNPVSSKSVIRTVYYKQFDLPKGIANWRRTDYFESGDSAVSQGGGEPGGAGSYSQVLGQGAKNAGTYDAATGAFADTTSLLGFKGELSSREIAWGKVDAAKGTGDYQVKRMGGRDTGTVHVTVEADGKGFKVTRTSTAGSLTFHMDGDSATMTQASGGVERTYTWEAIPGASRVTERDVRAGTEVAAGEYVFGQDLSGSGTLKKTPAGKAAVEAKVQFQSDGTIFQDGVRVYP